LNVRIPYWATRGGSVRLNGTSFPVFASPGSYLTLHRTWNDGDRVEVSLPMSLHMDPLPGDETQQAVMYGPLVLAGRLGNSGLSKSNTYLGYNTTPGGKPVAAPDIHADGDGHANWVEPVRGQNLTFRTVGQARTTEVIPLYKLHGERYVVYWKVNPGSDHRRKT